MEDLDLSPEEKSMREKNIRDCDDFVNLWPKPPLSSVGVPPACLHAGGPPGPVVFGPPRVKVPETRNRRPLEERNDNGKSKELETDRLIEKGAKAAGAGRETRSPGSKEESGLNVSRKRKRDEKEVIPPPLPSKPLVVKPHKRVSELRKDG